MADIGALRCTFSDHREDANGIKGQSLLIGSGAAQKAAILDPADLLRKLDFVIRATVSVSQQLRVVVCALLRRSQAAPGLLAQLGTPYPCLLDIIAKPGKKKSLPQPKRVG
jgi:hypothetical protein